METLGMVPTPPSDTTPVVLLSNGMDPLRVRLPFRPDNRTWLSAGHRSKIHYVSADRCWLVPRAWLKETIKRVLSRFGRVYVIQSFNRYQRCAPKCCDAKSISCRCSCLGENHGSRNPLNHWFVISETYAIRWQGEERSCRLLTSARNPIAGHERAISADIPTQISYSQSSSDPILSRNAEIGPNQGER